MTLDDIRKSVRSGAPVALEVHALSASVYQLFRRIGNRVDPIMGSLGGSVVFRSRYAALQTLADLGVERVDCVHRSAYDEMIGAEGVAADNELRESVPIAHLRGG
ncbi:MAG: DUF6482 family protein [Pseudomonadales bacterium]